MATTTLLVARQGLARMVGDLVTGVATGGGVDNLTAQALADAGVDDFYNNFFVLPTSGNELGNERKVSDFTQGTGKCDVYYNWTTGPAATDTFELHRLWKTGDYTAMLNLAMDLAYPDLSRQIVDTSITTADDDYEIALPSPLRVVTTVRYEVDEDTAEYPYKLIPHKVREADDDLTLILEPPLPPSDRTLRVEGWGTVTKFTNDASTTELNSRQIVLLQYMAAHLLFGTVPPMTPSYDREHYEKESQKYLGFYNYWKGRLGSKKKTPRVMAPGVAKG